jgi:ApbE superfamily uncharacterized protein (UPF0280 family)
MRRPPQAQRFPDGRLHLHDGPIDLIVEAFGDASAVDMAYEAATRRFATILDELCSELPLLRATSRAFASRPTGFVAGRMCDAVAPFHADRFITPMAAVAGAVAEEILSAMTSAAPLKKAYVNNGGDIALHLARGERFAIGMVSLGEGASLFARATIVAENNIRGLATSGWRGRSFSFGIADAVTVLARSASLADSAATLIANAVDLPGHPEILRAPAKARDPQSDLGDRLVTVGVGHLMASEIDRALDAGVAEAELWRRRGAIVGAALRLGGEIRVVSIPLNSDDAALGDGRDRRARLHQRSEQEALHAVG